MDTTGRSGRSMSTVRSIPFACQPVSSLQKPVPLFSIWLAALPLTVGLWLDCECPSHFPHILPPAQSRFLVSGSADNTMRLWSVQSGKCLFFWEFPTAVKRVAFNEDDDQVVCITEQRMGFQGAVRIFNINRDGDGTARKFTPCVLLSSSTT